MKRTVLAVAVMSMALVCTAAMCTAQMPSSHPRTGGDGSHEGTQASPMPSSRTEFGEGCGIKDTSAESAVVVARSNDGEWATLDAGSHSGLRDSVVARVWRESSWMVDMHAALGQGMASMHTGQMCFDPEGRITHMIDRYMEMARCGCVRFTSLTYATDGRVTRREQRFVNVTTGSEIEAPEASKGFPEVWNYRRVEQLPFYALVKR